MSQVSSHLSSDRPQTDPGQDLLGYAPFAKMLAHSVLRGSPSDGLVVGIYGEWGLGKTTLLNFVEHFTQADAGDDAPIIIRFNPWWFSGREDLLRRFFKDFETAVLKRRARNTKLRDALQKFGEAVGNVPSAWVAGIGKVMAAATKLGQPADVVGLKDAIVQALSAEALRVIVLVDDIDRLLPSEMVDVFRLVRSVGDFPNVHYVLAFDRQVVVKALTDECHTDGERYLEKIIQAPFELPRPGSGTLRGLFTHRLTEILTGTDDELFDAKYWSEVFLQGIAPFLRTPRDVTRLINALAVIYPTVKNEVNPVDFVAIETLRMFSPEVYDLVRSNRTRFTGMMLSVDHLRDENKQFHEQWLSTVTRNRDAVRATVVRLFPAMAALLARTGRTPEADARLRKARRICAEQVFDVYFRYSLDRGLSRAAFLACLDRSPEDLKTELKQYSTERLEDGHTKLRWFLEMLRDELSTGTGVKTKHLLEQLCSLGDTVIAGTPRALSFEVPDDFLLMSVIEKLLETLPATERAATLQSAMDPAGVSTQSMLVMFLGGQHGRHGEQPSIPEERTIPSEADLEALEARVRDRIESASRDGTLWKAARFPRILFDWIRLGGEARMRDAVRQWAADDGNLISLLGTLRGPSVHGRDSVDIGALTSLVDLDEVIGRAEQLLAQPTVAQPVRDLLQVLLNTFTATAPARKEQQARHRVLVGMLQETDRTGWFPTMHWLRTTFEADRALVDRLVEEKAIQPVLDAQYMLTLGGLQLLGTHPLAARELRACGTLLRELQAAYRQDPKVKVDLAHVATQRPEGERDVNGLRRAALVLLVHLGGTPTIQLEFAAEGGRPSGVSPGDGILDVSLPTS